MGTEYVAIITGAGNPSTGPRAVPIINGNAGDHMLNAVVLSGGSVAVGTDVTNDFQLGGVPSAAAVFGIQQLANVNFSGAFVIQQGSADLTGTVILALMQRP